ncbi:calcium uptake protein 3, mitochondrial isoform X6 [Eurosta solidaginis]|uniref:calcium uptake protein 3, mitochondrial isoform X6 n=1 Tax=Eurosta solidaginis TaxID=178769 RepID=UPI003530BCF0
MLLRLIKLFDAGYIEGVRRLSMLVIAAWNHEYEQCKLLTNVSYPEINRQHQQCLILICYIYLMAIYEMDDIRGFVIDNMSDEENMLKKLTSRERRFIKFASTEYDGQLYMTPQDFLDSVVEQEPRPRLKRRVLSGQDLQVIKDNTPPLKKGSKMLFRTLRDRGIVSYTEYLFLLSVLTKPISGFRIAFNMFDTDGNHRVEKDEFLVILRILGGTFKRSKFDDETSRLDDYIDDEEGLQRKHRIDTTLQIHLFGKKGNQGLNYDGFHKFMDNLQTEVLELEFNEFSKGNVAITENDFAKILLRYTYLNTEEYDAYLERLMDRIKVEHGITFEEFRDFCRFLNNLEDFAIAMRMYTLADRAISQSEFSRAVKICTGFKLSKHLIDTVFAIFDDNGDGMLSYREFIAIMKDRVHRGFKSSAKSEGWDAFRHCVKHEMKHSVEQ